LWLLGPLDHAGWRQVLLQIPAIAVGSQSSGYQLIAAAISSFTRSKQAFNPAANSAGQGTIAAIGAVGITGDTTVAL